MRCYMVDRLTNFFSRVSQEVSPPKTVKRTGQEAAVSLTKRNINNIGKFLADNDLYVSLRSFTRQITSISDDIIYSNLPRNEKIAALKTAVLQLEKAIEGRKSLIENFKKLGLVDSFKLLLSHGKTVNMLEKSLLETEIQMAALKKQIQQLQSEEKPSIQVEKEEKSSSPARKPLPLTPLEKELTDYKTEKTLEELILLFFRAGDQKVVSKLIPAMPSVIPLSELLVAASNQLEQRIEHKKNIPAKEAELKAELRTYQDHLALVLANTPKAKFTKPEIREQIAASLYHLAQQGVLNQQLIEVCILKMGKESLVKSLRDYSNNFPFYNKGFSNEGINKVIAAIQHANPTVWQGSGKVPSLSFGEKLKELTTVSSEERGALVKIFVQSLTEDMIELWGKQDLGALSEPEKDPGALATAGVNVLQELQIFLTAPNISDKERTKRMAAMIDLQQEFEAQKNIMMAQFIGMYFQRINDTPLGTKLIKNLSDDYKDRFVKAMKMDIKQAESVTDTYNKTAVLFVPPVQHTHKIKNGYENLGQAFENTGKISPSIMMRTSNLKNQLQDSIMISRTLQRQSPFSLLASISSERTLTHAREFAQAANKANNLTERIDTTKDFAFLYDVLTDKIAPRKTKLT